MNFRNVLEQGGRMGHYFCIECVPARYEPASRVSNQLLARRGDRDKVS